MLQIVYVSVARQTYTPAALEVLGESLARRNKAEAVSGVLLFRAGTFFQVLEGTEEGIHRIFELIRTDQEHGHIRVLVRRYIHKREFEDWSMSVLDAKVRLASGHHVAHPERPLPLLADAPTAATRHMHLFAAGFHHPLDLESRAEVTPGRPYFETANGVYRSEKPRLLFRRSSMVPEPV